MKALVVEDDFANRKILQKILSPNGEVDIAVNAPPELIVYCETVLLPAFVT